MNQTALIQKIALGTVQLGLPYGINNATGKPDKAEAFRILNFAYENKIQILDTADGYGEAIKVIGNYTAETKRSFRIVNKFKIDSIPLRDKLFQSLEILKASSLYCYMYHQFSDYEAALRLDELKEFKRNSTISKIGVSLYGVEQLRQVINDRDIDLIQLPSNLLDSSSEKETLLKQAKKSGKEIHARSIYLQGLFFKDPNSLTGNLIALKPYLEKIKSICHQHQLDIKSAALNYVLHKEYIDYVVLGIDQASQLAENLSSIEESFDESALREIAIDTNDQYLLNPSTWKP
ncbi:MAG TPA: aldo/keto reductase [Cyclobacteriaceae bacterium]|nr:aldo/keto reductase [Cyclobacteriaceae bacterium]